MQVEEFKAKLLKLFDLAEQGNPVARYILARLGDIFYASLGSAEQVATMFTFNGEVTASQPLVSSSEEPHS